MDSVAKGSLDTLQLVACAEVAEPLGPGQIRMRVRYKGYRTPWFDYLFVSEAELHGLVQGTGWRAAEILRSEGAVYAAVLEKA